MFTRWAVQRRCKSSMGSKNVRKIQEVIHGGDGWDKCWEQGLTPWDIGRPTPVLVDLLEKGGLPKGRALVPGCGTGYDVVAIAGPERFVVGLEISEHAIKRSKELFSSLPNANCFKFLVGDFFSWRPTELFDLIFDYTFFCAIEPSMRPAWASQVRDMLKPDGELITLMFPIGDREGGPPYNVSLDTILKTNSCFGFKVTGHALDSTILPFNVRHYLVCSPCLFSAINAFRRLKDDPNAQLLDVRNKQSLSYMNSPNLRILNKTAVQVEFTEGDEENFVRKVLENFQDPEKTWCCAFLTTELLFKRGFKEAYAIKGGLRGKDGWQAIQETLLPPSMHVYPRKKNKGTTQIDGSRETPNEHVSFGDGVSTTSTEGNLKNENGSVAPNETSSSAKIERSLSPYPNYPDLKPPSSPTPSKP
ncbi:putative thiol methyltransferase 2 [Acorus calamus]|uniref:Thiol methyltransferase 2 n=1 Tax=Acorus calamus TaxID=4465 RepID=A0AAV9F1N4_ACOCL|nr:putative thiol methyltransferase 2 [Acorus calamus]